MAPARRSMTPFYVALGAIAAAGGVLIASGLTNRRAAPLTLATAGPAVAAGPRGVVIGSDSAPVEIAEYADFECPACARFAAVQMPDIMERLINSGRARWRFLHYPLPQHGSAPYAHLAAACARRQGRFWEMHDLLYQGQADWAGSNRPERILEGYAERVGLDMAAYRRCVADREAWGEVIADRALGDSVRVDGTPTFYVNGRKVENIYSADQFVRLVETLAPAAPAAPQPR